MPGFSLSSFLQVSMGFVLCLILCSKPSFASDIDMQVKLGRVHKPLPIRIVSFHRGRANKDLIRRAAELGYNGVQFQLEGGNVGPLKDFAERDKKEHYIELCHKLGMKVTLWVHEFSEIPDETSPEYLGPISVDNQKLWDYLSKRYDWVFGELLPDVDGLVLTVVETQVRATDKDIMRKIVDVIGEKCRKYHKELTVRTFVWHPKELVGVLGCVKELPSDVVIMSKCVPQDWQMRGIDSKEIGEVGDHVQVEEYDVQGEYFLRNAVANCMPDLLKRQFDYGTEHGVDGICVRVDRDNDDILQEPQEINMWALGMFAAGDTDSVDDVWKKWSEARYGKDAADGVVKALKQTSDVVTECLNIGSFSFGDNRGALPDPENNVFYMNWANFRWDSSYVPEYLYGWTGDRDYTKKIEAQKQDAMWIADRCLADLEQVKDKLSPADYEVLKTKLSSNKLQLEYRAPMMIAYLKYRRIVCTGDDAERKQLASDIRSDLKIMRDVAEADYPKGHEVESMGKKWRVGAPEWFHPGEIIGWTDKMESMLKAHNL